MKRWPLLVIIMLVVPFVVADSVWDYLTIGQGDQRYCKMYGNCVINNLTVNGAVFNVSVVNFNVTGMVESNGWRVTNGSSYMQTEWVDFSAYGIPDPVPLIAAYNNPYNLFGFRGAFINILEPAFPYSRVWINLTDGAITDEWLELVNFATDVVSYQAAMGGEINFQFPDGVIVGNDVEPNRILTSNYCDDAGATCSDYTALQDHNQKNNLQGGAPNEYYHLTAAEYTDLNVDIGNWITQAEGDARYQNFTGLTLGGVYITDWASVNSTGDDTNWNKTYADTLYLLKSDNTTLVTAYTQAISDNNLSVVNYVDNINLTINTKIDNNNISMKAYVDQQNTTMTSYVDSKVSSVQTSIKYNTYRGTDCSGFDLANNRVLTANGTIISVDGETLVPITDYTNTSNQITFKVQIANEQYITVWK